MGQREKSLRESRTQKDKEEPSKPLKQGEKRKRNKPPECPTCSGQRAESFMVAIDKEYDSNVYWHKIDDLLVFRCKRCGVLYTEADEE